VSDLGQLANDPSASVEAVLELPDGSECPISPHGSTIGRRADSEVMIDDPSVSRRHAQIFCRGEAFYLTDLGSSNGTLLNGRRVTEEASLSDGDVLQFGDTILTFHVRRPQPATGLRPAPVGAPAPPEPEETIIALSSPEASSAAGVASSRTSPRLRIALLDPTPAPGQPAHLQLTGVLDIETAEQLRAQTRPLLEAGVAHFVLDMGDLEYLDSSGLAALVALQREVKPVGGSIRFQRLQPAVRGIIQLTRLDRIFTIQ
jgi:anti-anti-sigma factor